VKTINIDTRLMANLFSSESSVGGVLFAGLRDKDSDLALVRQRNNCWRGDKGEEDPVGCVHRQDL